MINLDRKAAERVRIGPFCRMGLSPRISKIQKVLDRSVKYYFRFTWHTTGVNSSNPSYPQFLRGIPRNSKNTKKVWR